MPINLLGHVFHISNLEFYSKPLLLPTLMGYFLSLTNGVNSKNKKIVFGALFFSWVGDVALMYDQQFQAMFMVGLGGFLVAHIHYSYVFIKSGKRVKSITKISWIALPIMVLYTVGLLSFLWPNLGELKIPVFVYALVLLSMGVTALIRNQKTGYVWVLTGAIFFIISDSILAINKFNAPLEWGRVLTMLTYTMAQLFIVIGLAKTLGNAFYQK
ncbi:MAG: lysoplasmalogenase [Salibacteraceae bacterium]